MPPKILGKEIFEISTDHTTLSVQKKLDFLEWCINALKEREEAQMKKSLEDLQLRDKIYGICDKLEIDRDTFKENNCTRYIDLFNGYSSKDYLLAKDLQMKKKRFLDKLIETTNRELINFEESLPKEQSEDSPSLQKTPEFEIISLSSKLLEIYKALFAVAFYSEDDAANILSSSNEKFNSLVTRVAKILEPRANQFSLLKKQGEDFSNLRLYAKLSQQLINIQPAYKLTNFTQPYTIAMRLASATFVPQEILPAERAKILEVYKKLEAIEAIKPLLEIIANACGGQYLLGKQGKPLKLRATTLFKEESSIAHYNPCNNIIDFGFNTDVGREFLASTDILTSILAHEMHHAWDIFKSKKEYSDNPIKDEEVFLKDMLEEALLAISKMPGKDLVEYDQESYATPQNAIKVIFSTLSTPYYSYEAKLVEMTVRVSEVMAYASLQPEDYKREVVAILEKDFPKLYKHFGSELVLMSRYSGRKSLATVAITEAENLQAVPKPVVDIKNEIESPVHATNGQTDVVSPPPHPEAAPAPSVPAEAVVPTAPTMSVAPAAAMPPTASAAATRHASVVPAPVPVQVTVPRTAGSTTVNAQEVPDATPPTLDKQSQNASEEELTLVRGQATAIKSSVKNIIMMRGSDVNAPQVICPEIKTVKLNLLERSVPNGAIQIERSGYILFDGNLFQEPQFANFDTEDSINIEDEANLAKVKTFLARGEKIIQNFIDVELEKIMKLEIVPPEYSKKIIINNNESNKKILSFTISDRTQFRYELVEAEGKVSIKFNGNEHKGLGNESKALLRIKGNFPLLFPSLSAASDAVIALSSAAREQNSFLTPPPPPSAKPSPSRLFAAVVQTPVATPSAASRVPAAVKLGSGYKIINDVSTNHDILGVANIWASDTERGNKYKVLESAYPDDSKDKAQQIILAILVIAAKKTNSSYDEVIEVIKIAKQYGGVGGKYDVGSKRYSREDSGLATLKQKSLSTSFQALCKACGIISARESSEQGLRLTFLPHAVINEFAVLDKTKLSSCKDMMDQVEAKIRGVKSLGSQSMTASSSI